MCTSIIEITRTVHFKILVIVYKYFIVGSRENRNSLTRYKLCHEVMVKKTYKAHSIPYKVFWQPNDTIILGMNITIEYARYQNPKKSGFCIDCINE